VEGRSEGSLSLRRYDPDQVPGFAKFSISGPRTTPKVSAILASCQVESSFAGKIGIEGYFR